MYLPCHTGTVSAENITFHLGNQPSFMGVIWRTLTRVDFGLQDYTSRFACAESHTQDRSHVARFKIIVGLQLLPRNEFLLGVDAGSSDKVSEDVSILDLRPTSHVRAESLI